MSDDIERARALVRWHVDNDCKYETPQTMLSIAVSIEVHRLVESANRERSYNEAIDDLLNHFVLKKVALEMQRPSEHWYLTKYDDEARELQHSVGVLATWQLVTTQPMVGVDVRNDGLFVPVLWAWYEDASQPPFKPLQTLREAMLVAEKEADRIEKMAGA